MKTKSFFSKVFWVLQSCSDSDLCSGIAQSHKTKTVRTSRLCTTDVRDESTEKLRNSELFTAKTDSLAGKH